MADLLPQTPAVSSSPDSAYRSTRWRLQEAAGVLARGAPSWVVLYVPASWSFGSTAAGVGTALLAGAAFFALALARPGTSSEQDVDWSLCVGRLSPGGSSALVDAEAERRLGRRSDGRFWWVLCLVITLAGVVVLAIRGFPVRNVVGAVLLVGSGVVAALAERTHRRQAQRWLRHHGVGAPGIHPGER